MSASSTTSGFNNASPAVLKDETKKYFKFIDVILALSAITFVEMILIILPFAHGLKFTALIVLSIVKFIAVIWYFMHLRWDKFLLTLLFIGGLVLSGGTVYALMHLFEAPPAETTTTTAAP